MQTVTGVSHHGSSGCDVPFVASVVVDSATAAVAAAASVGYPLVMKLATPGLAHKSDVGGVVTGIVSEAEVRSTYARLAALDTGANVAVDGLVELQSMVEGGLEVIVGVHSDAIFGMMVTVGLGGVWTEVLHDVTTEMCPVSPAGVIEMLQRLKSAPLFTGYRGTAAYDLDAVADVVSRLSVWAAEQTDVVSVEFNPLMVRPAGGGVVAVDVLLQTTG